MQATQTLVAIFYRDSHRMSSAPFRNLLDDSTLCSIAARVFAKSSNGKTLAWSKFAAHVIVGNILSNFSDGVLCSERRLFFLVQRLRLPHTHTAFCNKKIQTRKPCGPTMSTWLSSGSMSFCCDLTPGVYFF